MKTKIFPNKKGSKMIEHLISQKENINLDKDDNLISVYLTEDDINYLIGCVKSEEVEYNIYLQQLDNVIDNEIEYLKEARLENE